MTQLGIVDKVREQNFFVDQSKISKVLKEIEITRKRLLIVPVERNTPKTLDFRSIYARDLEIFL